MNDDGSLSIFAIPAIAIIWYAPFVVAAFRLMALGGYDRQERALVPILNVAILFDLAGLSRVLLLLFLVPAANLLVLPGVAGCIAAKSGRAPWVWWIAGIPLIHIVGLPILAFTCRSVPGPAPAPDATESAIRAMAAEGVADSEMQTLLNAKGLGGPTGGQSPHDLRERRKVQFSDDYATRMPSI